MKPTIRLEPVTSENWKSCIALELDPSQENYVPSNLYSIAESQFYDGAESTALYNEQDQLVGYALWGKDVATGKWKVFRIMIDKSHQGKGYGKSAMQAIIKQISERPNGNEILIRYRQSNVAACSLYKKLGFVEQEVDPEGVVTALLEQNIQK